MLTKSGQLSVDEWEDLQTSDSGKPAKPVDMFPHTTDAKFTL